MALFGRSGIIHTMPGMKDQKYLGKETIESSYAKNYCLLWTSEEISFILNGGALVKTGKSFHFKFSKEITFRQLYQFVKSHPELTLSKAYPSPAACVKSVRIQFISLSI